MTFAEGHVGSEDRQHDVLHPALMLVGGSYD